MDENTNFEKPMKLKPFFSKENRKMLLFNLIESFATAFILAILTMLSDINNYQSAAEFFTGKVFFRIAIITVLMFIMIGTTIVYACHLRKNLAFEKKGVSVMNLGTIITFGVCLLFGELINLYVVPLMLAPILIATLIDKRAGIVSNILLSQAFFITYMIINHGFMMETAAALITSMVAGIFMILFFDKAGTRIRFVLIGVIIGLVSAIIPILINLLSGENGVGEILMSGVWSFLSTILAIALYMVVLPVFEYIFKLNTNFRLAEISSFEFPLLKKLAEEAPGTFNHSLVVGNLSELCASAIGENALLAKAAAYYHDVGKMKQPECFVENQKGYNPHDDLIPEVSVNMITSHTRYGYELIKKAGLPDIIADIALEHHGTTPVNYFLYKAQNVTEEDLDKFDFSYQDPKPRSKTAAIIMIVDTVEAASRAHGASITAAQHFRAFVHKLINEKAELGQFTDCDITFKDLQIIEDVLVETIPNMYHARIQYNKK